METHTESDVYTPAWAQRSKANPHPSPRSVKPENEEPNPHTPSGEEEKKSNWKVEAKKKMALRFGYDPAH